LTSIALRHQQVLARDLTDGGEDIVSFLWPSSAIPARHSLSVDAAQGAFL
jgi:hypothetical protein